MFIDRAIDSDQTAVAGGFESVRTSAGIPVISVVIAV